MIDTVLYTALLLPPALCLLVLGHLLRTLAARRPRWRVELGWLAATLLVGALVPAGTTGFVSGLDLVDPWPRLDWGWASFPVALAFPLWPILLLVQLVVVAWLRRRGRSPAFAWLLCALPVLVLGLAACLHAAAQATPAARYRLMTGGEPPSSLDRVRFRRPGFYRVELEGEIASEDVARVAQELRARLRPPERDFSLDAEGHLQVWWDGD